MTRQQLKAMSKAQMKPHFWMLVLICIVGSLLSGIPGVGFLIAPAMSLGLCTVFLNITYGKRAELNDLFSGFQNFGRALWLNIQIAVFTYLWSLLFVIPGIIKGLSYSMAFFVLSDHPEMTASQALNESKRIMEGHKMELFILELSFVGWYLLASFTFGLSLLHTIPYQNTVLANFYNTIKGAPAGAAYQEY